MTSAGAFVFSVLMTLVLLGVFLTVLYFVVSAAVEQGIRRSLPDSSLRPSVREQLRRQQPLRREDEW